MIAAMIAATTPANQPPNLFIGCSLLWGMDLPRVGTLPGNIAQRLNTGAVDPKARPDSENRRFLRCASLKEWNCFAAQRPWELSLLSGLFGPAAAIGLDRVSDSLLVTAKGCLDAGIALRNPQMNPVLRASTA